MGNEQSNPSNSNSNSISNSARRINVSGSATSRPENGFRRTDAPRPVQGRPRSRAAKASARAKAASAKKKRLIPVAKKTLKNMVNKLQNHASQDNEDKKEDKPEENGTTRPSMSIEDDRPHSQSAIEVQVNENDNNNEEEEEVDEEAAAAERAEREERERKEKEERLREKWNKCAPEDLNPNDFVIGNFLASMGNGASNAPFVGSKGGFGKKGFMADGPVVSVGVTHGTKEKSPFGGRVVEVRNGKRIPGKPGIPGKGGHMNYDDEEEEEEEVVERISQLDRQKPTLQFATMKYSRKAKYSETYCLYTTDEHLLNELPPPHPPYTKKSEIFDPLAYIYLDRKSMKVPKVMLNRPLSELTTHLTKPCRDDIGKIRALYVWLTSQNIPKIKFPIKPTREGTVIDYLQKIKKRKGNYAQLFSHMCNLAGLPCAVIHGYLKGNTFEIGKQMSRETHYGEWNAILVDNYWRFCNTYWGACAVGTDTHENVTDFRFDENFFLTDPEQLAYSHFPDEPIWQLLDTPITIEEFETKAFFKERFFELEMRVLSHPNAEVEVEHGEVEFLFGLNPARAKDLRFMTLVYMKEDKGYKLLYDDENRYQHDFICFPNDDSFALKVRFPKKGTYRIELVGKDSTVDAYDYDYDWVAIYKVNVVSGPVKYAAFPKCADAGWGNSDDLKELGLKPATEHAGGVVMADDGYCRISFMFLQPQAAELQLSYKLIDLNRGLDEVPLEENGFEIFQNEEFVSKMQVPPGDEIAFCMFTQVEDETYGSIERNLCNYLIMSIPARELDKTTHKTVFDGKAVLNNALHFKQLEMIERAVDLVETRRHEGHMLRELNEAKDLAKRLKKVSQLMHNVLALDQKSITEVRSMKRPYPEVHDIMKATFLLLGNYEEETRDWKNVQLLMSKPGRQSLKRRVNMFDINHCKLDVALGAKFLLGDMDLEHVKSLSKGASTFYIWASGMVNEICERRFDQIEATRPRIYADRKNKAPLTRLPRSYGITIEEEDDSDDDEEDDAPKPSFWSRFAALFKKSPPKSEGDN